MPAISRLTNIVVNPAGGVILDWQTVSSTHVKAPDVYRGFGVSGVILSCLDNAAGRDILKSLDRRCPVSSPAHCRGFCVLTTPLAELLWSCFAGGVQYQFFSPG
jgi:hypothetical protein